MRHFPRLNRVACGILRRWHPGVLTHWRKKPPDFRQDLGRRAPRVIYCASVSPNLRCVSTIVRPTPTSVSDNVRRKRPSIARLAVYHCASLHVVTGRSRFESGKSHVRLAFAPVTLVQWADPRGRSSVASAAGSAALDFRATASAVVAALTDF
jgi:hypothetical protein